jgi:hypothetical protein
VLIIFVYLRLNYVNNHAAIRPAVSIVAIVVCLDCRMFSSRPILLRTISEASYLALLLITIVAIGLSCVALLSQAVRTAWNQSWTKNINALVIGASYAIVVCNPRATVVTCLTFSNMFV